MKRREALKRTALIGGSAFTLTGLSTLANANPFAPKDPIFKISLAQWSLHKSMHRWNAGNSIGDKLDPLDFARIAKNDYGIDGLEYVNQFYWDKINDNSYLQELKKRADGEGCTSVLIMVDGEGALGAVDEAGRKETVEKHKRWVDAAAFLGCHSIRVNAQSQGSYEEQQKLSADGLHKLCEYGDTKNINIIVENHGGLSSNGEWLAGVMKMTDHPRVGTLPDFGNFCLRREPGNWGNCLEAYDRYKGTEELMPWAKGVSAKSNVFDAAGNETQTDYRKMMQIVLDHDYHGYVGVEYEGQIPEPEGIKLTRALLEKVREELS